MESSRRQSSEADARDSPNGNQGGSSIGHASSASGGVGGGSSIASSLIGGLDPLQQHYATAYSFAELKTYHCDHVRRMPMSGLDPSMLIGFLCRDEADWVDFRKRVAELPKPVFSIQDEPPRWPDEFEDDMGLMESVSSEADDIEGMGDDGEGEGIEGEEEEEEEGEEEGDGVKVEVEPPGGEGDGDAGSDEFFDTRSRSSAEGSPDKAVLVGNSGAAPPGRASTSTRSSTEEDPVDPVTPGPGSRFSLPEEKPIGKGGAEDEEDDDWVDSSLVTPGPTRSPRSRTVKLVVTGATPMRGEESQSPVLVEPSSSVQFPTMPAASDEAKNGPTKKGKSKRKQGDLALPAVRAPALVSSSRSGSSSKSSSKGKSKSGHSKSRHRRGDPSEATDDQEHYLFPGAGDDDDDYFMDGAEHATPLDRSRNNTAVAGGGEDAMVVLSGGRRMNNVRARDGGRTQSGGVKGVLTE